MPYKLSPQAAVDLKELLIDGVLKFGRPQAVKYQKALHSTFEALAAMPLMGRVSERQLPHEHRWTNGPYVIYYTVHEDGIVIRDIVPSVMVKDAWGDG